MQKMSLHEAMYTQRAIRNFTPDPVSDETVSTILDAAVRAPNGGNTQRWSFLVIRDRETKKRFGEWYLDAWTGLVADMNLSQTSAQPYRPSMLTQNMEDIPVLILACLDNPTPPHGPNSLTPGSSIYPAVQNIMLAARALGLGTVLTTLHSKFEDEVKALLGIPATVSTAALIPLGYPAQGERFGGGRRRPSAEVTFHERWGQRAAE
jgi:nitroreductase